MKNREMLGKKKLVPIDHSSYANMSQVGKFRDRIILNGESSFYEKQRETLNKYKNEIKLLKSSDSPMQARLASSRSNILYKLEQKQQLKSHKNNIDLINMHKV